MIQSKEDYHYYLEADRVALDKDYRRPRFFGDEVWKFQRLLRKAEYYENCKGDFLSRKYLNYLRLKLYRLGLQLGFSIPRNVFGPGLSIAHFGPILIADRVQVGTNCRIHHCVTIGVAGDNRRAPQIGDNVFIGTGAVIIGEIKIADGIAIGANSYVNKSFTEPGITIAGCPAKKVSDKGSEGLLVRATEVVKARTQQA